MLSEDLPERHGRGLGFRRPLTFSPMAYGPRMAMLPAMLEEDRSRAGWWVGQAAWRLGVSVHEYREIEAGERFPSWETWDRIFKLYVWPQTFVGNVGQSTAGD